MLGLALKGFQLVTVFFQNLIMDDRMKSWLQVRRHLGHKPIVEGLVDGPTPLYVERYHFRDIERSVPGIRCMTLLTQFGVCVICVSKACV